jgi:hypothetical protein
MALVLAVATMNGGCLLIPQLEDKIVELAVTGSTVVEFVSDGEINEENYCESGDFKAEVNIAQILDDAGIDISDVTGITLSGVAYRVTVPDPNAAREIVGGTITIDRGAGPVSLVTSFNAPAGSAYDWQTAPLDAAGVAEINDLLSDILTELQGGAPASSTIEYCYSGQSIPLDIGTNFTWQVRITISITGTIEVSVPT